RDLFKPVRSADRLNEIRVAVGGAAPSASFLEAATQAAGQFFKSNTGAIAVVGSGRSSVEEQFLTKKLADSLKASTQLVSRVGEGDKILVSADRNPNVRGA